MTGDDELMALAEDAFTKRVVTFSPEPEAQRGRKRRRTPVPFAIVTTTTKTLSGESATFRGRSRHRATSVLALSTFSSAFSSRNPSANRMSDSRSSASPASQRKKHHLRFVPLVEQQHRRRSQSPSRSRSATAALGGGGGDLLLLSESRRRRRRQRTRSRSRDHGGIGIGIGITSHPASAGGAEGVTSLASPLRVVELADVGSEGTRDGEDLT